MRKSYRIFMLRGSTAAGIAFVLGVLGPAAAQEVTLPLEDYEALRVRARAPEHAEPGPPAPVAFEEASIRVEVGEASATLTETLTVAVYADGWQRIPLAAAGSLIETRFAGIEARVEAGVDGKQDRSLVLRGRGRHRLTLVSAILVDRDPRAARQTWHLAIPTPTAALVHGTLEVPSSIEDVHLDDSSLPPPVPPARGYAFVAKGGASLSFRLEGPTTGPAGHDLPLRFVTATAVQLEATRNRRHVRAIIQLDVRQGQLDAFTVPVPSGFDVLAVDTDTRISWNVTEGRLRVVPAIPVSDSLRVEVRLAAAPAERFTAPVLTPDGADWSRTVVRAGVLGDGLLELVAGEDTRSPESDQEKALVAMLGPAPGKPLVVPAGSRPPGYALSWSEEAEVLAAQVDRLLVEVLIGDFGQAVYRTWIELRNTGAEELSIVLPAPAELISARRDGVATTPGRRGEAMTIPLAARHGVQILELEALVSLDTSSDPGLITVPLPALSIPATRVEARVLLPGGRRYRLRDAARLGTVREPATATRPEVASALARQLAVGQLEASVAANGFLETPAAWLELRAGWSALSSSPAPLVIDVEALRTPKEWF